MKKAEITKEKFNELRNDSKFVDIIDFGRLSNSFYFCLQTYLDYKDIDSPAGMRQKFRSLFFIIGLLYEGFNKVEKLRPNYEGQSYFDNGLGQLLKNTKTLEFKKWIMRVRNETVFHFDRKLVEKSLKNDKFELSEYIIFSGDSQKSGHLFFNLSDELEFFHHFSRRDPNKSEIEIAREAFSEIGDYLYKFTDCSNLFITGLVKELFLDSNVENDN